VTWKPRCLLLRPPARGTQLENGEPLGRRVVRAAVSLNSLHAGVLDAELLDEVRGRGLQGIDPSLEPDALSEVVLGGGAARGEGDLGHRDRMEQGRAEWASCR